MIQGRTKVVEYWDFLLKLLPNRWCRESKTRSRLWKRNGRERKERGVTGFYTCRNYWAFEWGGVCWVLCGAGQGDDVIERALLGGLTLPQPWGGVQCADRVVCVSWCVGRDVPVDCRCSRGIVETDGLRMDGWLLWSSCGCLQSISIGLGWRAHVKVRVKPVWAWHQSALCSH